MKTGLKTLDDIDPARRHVLVRLDLNMPIQDGRVTDPTRLQRSIPTLRELRDKGATTILLSHRGRPGGRVRPDMSLEPIISSLADFMCQPVTFVHTDWTDDLAEQAITKAQHGDLILLENTRFHPDEEKNAPALAMKMAALGDIYVNDAFSAAHRAHASTEGIAHHVPCAAGRAMEAELRALDAALSTPARPLLGLAGGSKISTKLNLLGNLVRRMDGLIIGGGMANTLLAARGINVGASLYEHDAHDAALHVMNEARAAGCAIILPIDALVARKHAENTSCRAVDLNDIAEDDIILDIGPRSIDLFSEHLAAARSLVWNGPLGVFEKPPFDTGTTMVAQKAGQLTAQKRLLSVAGGGDTVAALRHAGVMNSFSYVSTAGGAFLEWLEGRELPGISVLTAPIPNNMDTSHLT